MDCMLIPSSSFITSKNHEKLLVILPNHQKSCNFQGVCYSLRDLCANHPARIERSHTVPALGTKERSRKPSKTLAQPFGFSQEISNLSLIEDYFTSLSPCRKNEKIFAVEGLFLVFRKVLLQCLKDLETEIEYTYISYTAIFFHHHIP